MRRSVHACPPKGVVALPALRVGQDLVGVVDLLEPLLGLRLRVDIGVPLLGELAEGALDISVARAALDAQDFVQISFSGGHRDGSLREAAQRCRERAAAAIPVPGLPGGSVHGPSDDRVEHRHRQSARERVLLARVVRTE